MHEQIGNLQAEKRAMGVSVAREDRPEGGYLARLTIDNAAKLNSLNRELMLEIVDAVKQLIAEGVPAESVDDAAIAGRLYAPEHPDPDLLIRTGGELRVSNFLLWEVAYAEMWATQVLWPDFSVADLDAALESYAKRERRFGR